MNKEDAVKINGLVESIVGLSNEILNVVNRLEDDGRRSKIERALAFAVTELDLEILEPIYDTFPELRPPEMEIGL